MEERTMNGTMKFKRLTGDVGNATGLMRLKRLGKIRLGIKKQSAKSGREYPSATDESGNPIDYFIVPDEIKDVVGEKPKVLRGMFASNDPEEVYEESLRMYGSGSGLQCQGDGTRALRRQQNGEWMEMKCPCPFLKTDSNPTGTCTPVGVLKVMLPEVSMWGYFEIKTHSLYARAGILSSLKQLREMVGRIGFVPLRIERAAQEITHDGKKKTHWIVGFTGDLSLPQIIEMRTKPELMVVPTYYQLEAPDDTDPCADPVDVVASGSGDDEEQEHSQTIDAESLASMTDAEMERLQNEMAKRPVDQKKKVEPDGAAETPAMEHKRPTQQGSDAAPPITKAEPPKHDARANQKDIPDEDWNEAVRQIDENPDLRDLKERVKANMKIKTLKLIAPGQHEFIRQFRELCQQEGFGASAKQIFG